MAKVKKSRSGVKQTETVNLFEKLPLKIRYTLAVLIILIPVTFIFSPYVFENMRPSGTDVIATKGEKNIISEWQKTTGETALWNIAIFSGMPNYPRISPQLIHMDTIIAKISSDVYFGYIYFLVGAFGIFALLLFRGIPWYFAVIVAIAFSLLPDWQSLIGDGHFAKLRAIMILPWLILTFNYFFEKNSWLGVALFAFIFSWLLRTQHMQIVFYGILILFFLFIYPLIKLFVEKEYKKATSIFIKFSVAILLTLLTTLQPFLSLKEYTPYSTRGGNPVVLNSELETAQKSGGVSFEYATRWSLAPAEVMDFFIQRFHGGISGETYDGKEYSQLNGKQVPGYWGEKPFSGNYAYIGIILVLFAVIGAVKNHKDVFVISLTVFTLFSLLLSFGRHFPALYELFFYYMPYFSKFRAPAMMANITFISILILSGYGLKSFMDFKYPNDVKLLLGIIGAAIAIPVIVLILKDGFAYLTPADTSRYDANSITMIKNIRKEFLYADTIKLLWITIFTSGAMLLFYFRKIRVELITVFILILILFELGSANRRAADKIELISQEKQESILFRPNPVTDYLRKQPQTDRAIVLGREFQSNKFAYFYPTINGYSAIKMQNTQDIIENNIFAAPTNDKINWNIINMLGGKYVITNGPVPFLHLKQVTNDQQYFLYQNINALPKGWFVKSIKGFNTPEGMVKAMNDTLFNSADEAFFIKSENLSDTEFDSTGSVTLLENTPNRLEFKTTNPAEGFMMISEVYYPIGWQAILDGKEIEIFKMNHMLRGVKVPPGDHELILEFHPSTYFAGLTMVWSGNIIILLMIAGFYLVENEKLRNKILKKDPDTE